MPKITGQATKEAPYCPPYHTDPSAPVYRFPPGSCDTHAHICGPEASILYDPDRIYTPPDALLPAYEHMLNTLGVERMVLVQPSIYGEDNRVMLQAMRETSLEARGVAVVSMDIAQSELEGMDREGIRGARFNLVDVKNPKVGLPLDELTEFAQRIKPMGWHVEFLVHVDDYSNFEALFGNFPVEIVVGHYGYFRPGCVPDHPGFQGLLNLAESGRCWVKLTGPYRIAAEELPYADVDPFAAALIARAPHRLLWGSDWPHVMMKKVMPDDGHLADVFGRYTSDSSVRQQICVDNPATLYKF